MVMPMKVAACILGNRRVPYRMIVISRPHWDGQKDASGKRAPATSWITNTKASVGVREDLVPYQSQSKIGRIHCGKNKLLEPGAIHKRARGS